MPNDNWTPNRDRVELLAYQYWMERGCLHGCHEDDWYRAEQEIRRQRGEAPPAVPDRTVVGVFRSIDDARNVYDKLVAEGFTRGEVSVVANRTEPRTSSVIAQTSRIRPLPMWEPKLQRTPASALRSVV